MPELNLKQLEFTYIACASFTKHRNIIKKIRGTSNLKHLCRNEFNKACFAHDAAYFDSKDLTKTAISDNILKHNAYEISRNRKYDGYERPLASAVYKFLD